MHSLQLAVSCLQISLGVRELAPQSLRVALRSLRLPQLRAGFLQPLVQLQDDCLVRLRPRRERHLVQLITSFQPAAQPLNLTILRCGGVLHKLNGTVSERATVKLRCDKA